MILEQRQIVTVVTLDCENWDNKMVNALSEAGIGVIQCSGPNEKNFRNVVVLVGEYKHSRIDELLGTVRIKPKYSFKIEMLESDKAPFRIAG